MLFFGNQDDVKVLKSQIEIHKLKFENLLKEISVLRKLEKVKNETIAELYKNIDDLEKKLAAYSDTITTIEELVSQYKGN